MIMDRLYRGVCYAGIDTDPELKYPKVMFDISLVSLRLVYFICVLLLWYREPVVSHSPTNKVTLRRSLLVLSSCNMAILINVSKSSHTFWMIRCVMSVKDNVAVESLLRSSVQMSPVCKWVLKRPKNNSLLNSNKIFFPVLLRTLLGSHPFETRSRISQTFSQRRRWSPTCRTISLVLI